MFINQSNQIIKQKKKLNFHESNVMNEFFLCFIPGGPNQQPIITTIRKY